jgi:hypothetical protein
MIHIALGVAAIGASVLSLIRLRKSALDVPPEEEIYAGGPVGPGAPGFGGGPGSPMPAHPGNGGGQGPFTATPGPATGISIYPTVKPGKNVPVAWYNGPIPGW